MRHAFACLALAVVLGLAGWAVDAIAGRSPAPGLVFAWTHRPGPLLAALPAGQARVVNTWLSGRIVQLHVASMRDFGALPAAAGTIRLPEAGILLAGCG